MTNGNDYFDQLQESATNLRIHVPERVSQAVIEKINLAQNRSDFDLPKNVMYVKSIDKAQLSSAVHVARVKVSGWQIEVIRATKKLVNEEVIIAIINKVGICSSKAGSKDRRNGNNSVRRLQLLRR
jgi:hypothetical protein